MRIVYVGNYQHTWCSEVHFTRELESLGHQVNRLQEPPGGGNVTFLDELEHWAIDCEADIVMWTRTWGLPPEETTALWRRLERSGVKTASYHLDLYVGLRRQADVRHDAFWTTGTVFTPDGAPSSQAWFDASSINHVYSPPAVVSDECHPGQQRSALRHDVVFVGSPASAYHPEWLHRATLLDHLQRRYDRNFKRYGPGAKRMRGADLNDLYASARIVIGDSLCPAGHTRYYSDRAWETVGRGGFLLHPYVVGLEEHFTDGEHLRFYEYGDMHGLDELISYYLEHPEERRRIQVAGQRHVREDGETYRDRFRRALEVIDGAPVA